MKRQSKTKKAYRKPTLNVHGDIRALTQTKRGRNNDGYGKPRTKLRGGNA
jgi:hypothetical protein